LIERLIDKRCLVFPTEENVRGVSALDRHFSELDACHVFIGVYAWQYGDIPPGQELSITELEYRRARDAGLRCLFFLLDEDALWPRSKVETGSGAQKLEVLRAELRGQHDVRSFESPEDLCQQAVAFVESWAQSLLQADMEWLRMRRDRTDRQRQEIRERQRVINLRPLDMTHTFKNRIQETRALYEHLTDSSVRLVCVVGRGGIGKTALVCRALSELEQGILTVSGVRREFPIDGILYLSARSTGLSLERIFADVGRMLGKPAASELVTHWKDKETSLAAKVAHLMKAMQAGTYLILLDNLEDYLGEDGDITEEGLRLFVEGCLIQPGGTRLLITTRNELRVTVTGLPSMRRIAIHEGLPEDHAIALLREMDPQGMLGIRDSPEEDLRRAFELTQGVPRALEILAGILQQDPTASLHRLLEDEDFFGEQVVEQLVAEGYRRLSEDERRIMEALAVFDRPVDETAIAYLLLPWFPGMDFRAGLRHLARSYFISVNRVTGEYSLHPLDRDHAYRQIPETKEENGNSSYSRLQLELRAADFYTSFRKPKHAWLSIEDLTPQLSEFEHLVRAEEFERAYQVLAAIDRDYLFLWSHYTRLVTMRSKLLGHLDDPDKHAANCGRLGTAYRSLGDAKQALHYYAEARQICGETGDRRQEGIWLGEMGSAQRVLGQYAQAAGLYSRALEINRQEGDRHQESTQLGRLGMVSRALGKVDQAVAYCQQALDIARENRDHVSEERHLVNLGSAYRAIGGFKQAIESYERALSIARELGDPWVEGASLGNLGSAYRALGDFDRATDLYEQALAIDREIGDRRHEGVWLGCLGDVYRLRGEWVQAMKNYENGLTIAQEVGDRRGESYRLLGLGQVLLVQGSLPEARQHCNNSLVLDVPETSYWASLTLGTVLLHTRDLSALDSFQDAANRCRSILDQTPKLCEPCYALGGALAGELACNPNWTGAQGNENEGLLQPVYSAYQYALERCSAPGLLQSALFDLGLIRTAGIEGLDRLVALLQGLNNGDSRSKSG
jgi:tetratricopeptide (TPR) repeat protein